MRGGDVQQSAMFSYLTPEQRVPTDHPLRAIRQICDKILVELSGLFATMYSEIGRPSVPPEKLLRALLLQVLYTVRSKRMLTVTPPHWWCRRFSALLPERRRMESPVPTALAKAG